MRQLKLFIILSPLLSFITGQPQPIASNFKNVCDDHNTLTKYLSPSDKYQLKVSSHFNTINVGNDPRDS